MKVRLSAFAGVCLATFGYGDAQAASQTFDLQLVTLCEGAAVCNAPGINESYFQTIYSQIDITVNFLTPIIDNTLMLERDNGQIIPTIQDEDGRLIGGALFDFTESFRIGNTFNFDIEPGTIYMAMTGELVSPTLGVAFLDAPSAPFGIVENFAANNDLGAAAERFTTAVLAHEVGHVLGGEHENVSASTDLLQPSITRSDYNSATFVPTFSTLNAAAIQSSSLLTEVTTIPLPATLPALLGGGVLLFGLHRSGLRKASVRSS